MFNFMRNKGKYSKNEAKQNPAGFGIQVSFHEEIENT